MDGKRFGPLREKKGFVADADAAIAPTSRILRPFESCVRGSERLTENNLRTSSIYQGGPETFLLSCTVLSTCCSARVSTEQA